MCKINVVKIGNTYIPETQISLTGCISKIESNESIDPLFPNRNKIRKKVKIYVPRIDGSMKKREEDV